MGLDVRVIQRRKIKCHYCGEVVDYKDIEYQNSGGRAWYDVLEPIGYYVPYDQRTEENDWYGQDMVLTDAQTTQVRNFVAAYDVYNGKSIANLIAAAKCDGDEVVINADW